MRYSEIEAVIMPLGLETVAGQLPNAAPVHAVEEGKPSPGTALGGVMIRVSLADADNPFVL
jgi:hypothetical protein